MVRPPPGVSRGSSVPPISSVRPRDSASPSPTPGDWQGSPTAGTAETPGRTGFGGCPVRGPRPAPPLVAVGRTVSSGGVPGGEYRRALPARFTMTRSMSSGSTMTSGSPAQTRNVTDCGPTFSMARSMMSPSTAGRGNTDSFPPARLGRAGRRRGGRAGPATHRRRLAARRDRRRSAGRPSIAARSAPPSPRRAGCAGHRRGWRAEPRASGRPPRRAWPSRPPSGGSRPRRAARKPRKLPPAPRRQLRPTRLRLPRHR